MIRPTLILQMNLDESVYSDEVVAEIKRSYSYVAPALVSQHETGDAAPENTMRFVVKIHRPYWSSSEEGADDLWNEVMLTWLKNMVYKVSSTMVAYNRVRREKAEPQLVFDWLEVEFGEVVLAMRLNADCSLEEHGASETADFVRALANEGALGEGIACVRIPSRASYEAQEAAVKEARARKDELEGEGVEGLEEAPAEEAFAEDAVEAEVEAEREPEPVNFDIDTTVWGIEYADGTVREFDSSARAFTA